LRFYFGKTAVGPTNEAFPEKVAGYSVFG